jgi:penicillin V acylase-like amidase (Ntn superfamily)
MPKMKIILPLISSEFHVLMENRNRIAEMLALRKHLEQQNEMPRQTCRASGQSKETETSRGKLRVDENSWHVMKNSASWR